MDLIEDYLNGYRWFCHWSSGDKKKYGNQVRIYNKDEAIEYIEKFNGAENCGISVSTIVDNVPKLLFLPFDFDSSNLKKAFHEASELYNKLVDWDYRASFHFSGGKGFHVIVPVVPKTYTKSQLANCQKFFSSLFNLRTLDKKVTQDRRRIIRIPGTYHIKSGNLCDIYEENEDGELLDIDDIAPPNIRNLNPSKHKIKNKSMRIDHPYPCIEKMISNEVYCRGMHPENLFEPPQIIRYAWVILRIAQGKSEKEMLREAEEWDDFDYDHTLYQIRHIARNGKYERPPSCKTLQSLGFCLDNCPYKMKWKPKKLER